MQFVRVGTYCSIHSRVDVTCNNQKGVKNMAIYKRVTDRMQAIRSVANDPKNQNKITFWSREVGLSQEKLRRGAMEFRTQKAVERIGK
jgi:hypothetical protein